MYYLSTERFYFCALFLLRAEMIRKVKYREAMPGAPGDRRRMGK